MPQELTYDGVVAMLEAAKAKVLAGQDQLAEIDSQVGDGDHGESMRRAFGAIDDAVATAQVGDLPDLLKKVSGNLMGINAGAIGPLLAMLFKGLAGGAGGLGDILGNVLGGGRKADPEPQAAPQPVPQAAPQPAPRQGGLGLDMGGLAEMFRKGLEAVQGKTAARPGDSTIMDALVPAVEALKNAAANGLGIRRGFAEAAAAAEAGAESTVGMQAKYGRAKNLGERSVGVADPGATSMGMMFRGFADAVRDLFDGDDDEAAAPAAQE